MIKKISGLLCLLSILLIGGVLHAQPSTSVIVNQQYYDDGKIKSYDSIIDAKTVLHQEFYSFGKLYRYGKIRNGLKEGVWLINEYSYDPSKRHKDLDAELKKDTGFVLK